LIIYIFKRFILSRSKIFIDTSVFKTIPLYINVYARKTESRCTYRELIFQTFRSCFQVFRVMSINFRFSDNRVVITVRGGGGGRKFYNFVRLHTLKSVVHIKFAFERCKSVYLLYVCCRWLSVRNLKHSDRQKICTGPTMYIAVNNFRFERSDCLRSRLSKSAWYAASCTVGRV